MQPQLTSLLHFFLAATFAIAVLVSPDHSLDNPDIRSSLVTCPTCPPTNKDCLTGRPTLTFLNLGRLGRLGNHLFQAAATVGVALAHDLCWAFPAEAAHSDIGRLFEHDLWQLNLTGVQHVPVHYESNQNYYEIELPVDDDDGPVLSLAGYFQALRYFDYHRDRIRGLFAFKSELVEAVEVQFPARTLQRAVGIHVRRGDYLSEPQTYTNLGIDYYEQALEVLDARIAGGIELVVVVSDDVEWCRRELVGRLPYPLEFSPFDDDDDDDNGKYLDFVLLASCRHLVIANSSFSWWAAYLKRLDETGLVVGPRPWYNRTSRLGHVSNSIDFYPPGWLLVDVERL